MEPLDEEELNRLLRKWEAPPAPETLKRRISAGRASWWSWLTKGTVRVPVPVALATAALIAMWIYYSQPRQAPRMVQPSTVSLADFTPVRQLEPVVVSGGNR